MHCAGAYTVHVHLVLQVEIGQSGWLGVIGMIYVMDAWQIQAHGGFCNK
jgi:hypothetical protein